MPIYFIRHGQSAFNASFKHGGPDPMLFDARLSDKGRAQADALRTQVSELGIKHVISSPLTRAIETSLRAFGDQMPIRIIDTHREWLSHSCDVGRPPGELAADFPSLDFSHLAQHWWHKGPANAGNVAAEPKAALEARVNAFGDILKNTTLRPVAIVGHGNFFREFIGRMMENCEIHAYQPTAG